ncbi:uncharacterized protein K441DRAFT_662742, partial [Cenococcum geophilum 1.58]|uniref:uncharacterized protein n=1 Tax=Cenococcum geophilum 1.58 TaxID=794803 RepID=UPI0035902068
MVILLAFDPCGGPNGRTEESLRALGDERAEERAIVRVYILGPAALATSSQALSVFLAVWRRGGGPRYNCACELTGARCRGFDPHRSLRS